MPVNDDELQLLEAYVDGELTTGEEDALRQRLANEPALTSALETIRAERAVRGTVWKSYEPTPAAVERVIAQVEHAVDRHNAWAYRLAKWRVPFAAAACILIGFSVGWLGRGKPDLGSTSREVIVQNPTTPPAQGTFVSNPGPPGGVAELVVVDEYGRVVARQQFSPQEAQKLIDSSNMWQQREEQIRNGGEIVPVNTGKF